MIFPCNSWKSKKHHFNSRSVGLEPTLPEGIWFLVRRLNHSATTASFRGCYCQHIDSKLLHYYASICKVDILSLLVVSYFFKQDCKYASYWNIGKSHLTMNYPFVANLSLTCFGTEFENVILPKKHQMNYYKNVRKWCGIPSIHITSKVRTIYLSTSLK